MMTRRVLLIAHIADCALWGSMGFLLGQIVDTNASYLARQLASIGVDVRRKTTVGDNLDGIATVIRNALEQSDIVITSGGIGPTVDDKTREAVAQAMGQELILDQNVLYCLRATASVAGFISFDMNWYEHTEKD